MSFEATQRAPAGERLAKNSIGIRHIVFFVVAAAAPLTAVVGASPAAFAFGNGAGVPGAFVLVGLLYLIFSAGFTAMGRHVGGAGAFYTYIAQGLGRPAGVAGAMIALLTYTSVQIAVYALLGVFMSGALAEMGLAAPWWACALAVLLLAYLAGQRNIEFSGQLLGVAMMAEILILLALDIGIVLQGGGPEGMSLSTFAPSTVFGPGLGVALVFVVGSFIGFESTAIFGEEARNPEKTIPRATYAAVLLITIFYAFSTWAIAQYYGPSAIQATAESGLETLFFVAAEQVLGGWSVQVMNILLIISLSACVLSFHNTLNRYFFAMAREGLLPHVIAAVHPKHGSPLNAGRLQAISAAAILLIFVAAQVDPYGVVFAYMSALAVLAILATQVLVSFAIIAYFRRTHGHDHSVLVTLVLPILALLGLVLAIVLVTTNLPLLTGSDTLVVRAFPVFVVLTGIGGAVFALALRRSKPALYDKLGSVFE